MAQLQLRLTPEQYLEGETVAEVRNEFVDGFVYEMAGTTEAHNDIKFQLTMWLGNRLPPGCRLFNGDVKLRIDASSDTRFYYPDLFVSCGPRDPKSYVRTDAIPVIEILSPTTERIDRGEKFEAYTSLASVEEYLLVSQDGAHVEVFRRRNQWAREIYESGDIIDLASIGAQVPLADIYRDMLL